MTSAPELDNELATHWVGLDVAKASFDAGLVRSGQHYALTRLRDVPAKSFARTPEGVATFLSWLDELLEDDQNHVRVCMEATGAYSTELAVWLLEQRPALQPAIVTPRHTANFIKSLGLRNKTDQLEARALAFYGLERRPVPYEPLTPERAELRELSRYRDALVQQKVAETNRAQEPQCSPVVRRLQKKRLHLVRADIERVEAAMKQIVNETPQLKHDVERLCSIYGVGFITAAIVLSELGDLRRFERARQLTAFAGLNPRIIQSGSSVRKRARMCKQGNPRLRQALYLAAVTAIRGDNDLQQIYQSIQEQGKPKKLALGAVMRKLLTIMRAMLIYEKPFDPYHKRRGKLRPVQT